MKKLGLRQLLTAKKFTASPEQPYGKEINCQPER
jgi:hypothetical protein